MNDRVAGEEPSPEVKAQITKIKTDIKSKSTKIRTAAYTSLGDLGEKAKDERKTLCEGMLDLNPMVSVAAADALKKVDEKLHRIALGIVIDKNADDVIAAEKLGKDAEPLVPLLLNVATGLSAEASPTTMALTVKQLQAGRTFRACVTALATIDPNNPEVNKAVIAMLSNVRPENRETGLTCLHLIKTKKTTLPTVLAMAANAREKSENRVRAINLIPELVDEKTTPMTLKALESLRFEKTAEVRDAVADTIKKLK